MTIEMIREVLLWCSIINIGIFIVSFLLFRFAHDWLYRSRGKWYNLSEEKFDTIYYAMMAFYKTCMIFFNIVPYVALRIAG
jgi:hypothetical protein